MTDSGPDDPLATDLAAFRAAVRGLVTSPAVDKWRGSYVDDVAREMRFTAGLLRVLYDAGLAGSACPPRQAARRRCPALGGAL